MVAPFLHIRESAAVRHTNQLSGSPESTKASSGVSFTFAPTRPPDLYLGVHLPIVQLGLNVEELLPLDSR
jgi:hypothetical protein